MAVVATLGGGGQEEYEEKTLIGVAANKEEAQLGR